MTMVMSFTRIVNSSERRFSSHPEAISAALGTLKPELLIWSLASVILPMAIMKDCWKPWFIKVTRKTFSVPHSSSTCVTFQIHPVDLTALPGSCDGTML